MFCWIFRQFLKARDNSFWEGVQPFLLEDVNTEKNIMMIDT